MEPPATPAATHERLTAGDWVEIRSADEITATLDADGRFDGLPFMPEMLPFCGRRMQVFRRAEKTCAVSDQASIRRMRGAVHLADARCDGGSHDGCQNGCLFFWKEAWLRPADGPGDPAASQPTQPSSPESPTSINEASLVTSLTGPDGETVYICQATELWRATDPLPWHNAGQYARDLRAGHLSPLGMLAGFGAVVWGRVEKLRRRVYGLTGRTPSKRLNLQAGDLVEVRSRKEIDATLDSGGHNRGLWWDPEMYRHCGKRFRVLRSLDRVVDEGTGKMRELKQPTVVLEGVVCSGAYHRFCPRSSYAYWREIWLRRV